MKTFMREGLRNDNYWSLREDQKEAQDLTTLYGLADYLPDFPVWMIDRLDREAGRLGVPRQSLIKVWIGEHLERDMSKKTKKKANKSG